MRKHINTIEKDDWNKLPFFAWECLTILLPHRQVDFIIRDEYQMHQLLKFLIYSLRTIDGTKGSADNLLRVLQKQSVEDFLKRKRRDVISNMRTH